MKPDNLSKYILFEIGDNQLFLSEVIEVVRDKIVLNDIYNNRGYDLVERGIYEDYIWEHWTLLKSSNDPNDFEEFMI